jgi:Sulfatase
LVAQSYQRHLLQLGFADRIVGELIGQLERVGLYDRVMIVVVADHGATFRPGLPRRDYTERSAGDIMRVPLFIKFPPGVSTDAIRTSDIGGQRVSDMNVQTIDIAPTVAQVAGVQVPWPTDGRSLLESRPPSGKVIYFESARRVAKLGDQGPDTDAAIRWKRSLFDGADPYRVLRADAFAELVGRPVRDLEIASGGGGEVHVDYLSDFENMDVSEESVAFDIAGRFSSAQARGTTYVAIAVNGVVRAVTRTWRASPTDWLATAPLSAWRAGRNTLEVFVVSQGAEGPVLRRSAIRPGRRDSPSSDEGTSQARD